MPHKNPEQRALYQKQYRLKHKEKLKAQHQLYYQVNKDYYSTKNKEWAVKNKEKVNQCHREWAVANREKIRTYHERWYSSNLEENRKRAREAARRYRQENPEKFLERGRLWYQANLDKARQTALDYYSRHRKERYAYRVKRYKTNTNFRLGNILRNRFYSVVKRADKTASVLKLVGCSLDSLKLYLESKFYPHPDTKEEMSWDNYGIDGWEIDHEIPCVAFNLADPEQQKACFHYTNLQPLWAKHNRRKSKKLDYVIGE